MYSYNSSHKVITILLVILWAIYQFSGRSDENNYYENGQIKCVGEKKNEINHGVWTWYYPNGNVLLQGAFQKGQRTGRWVRYNEHGNPVLESFYFDNMLNGICTEYDDSGNVLRKSLYSNDTILKRFTEIAP